MSISQYEMPSKVLSADEAASLIADGATITVSSSSGLNCPDAMLAAIGARFREAGHPRGLTALHPIAAGDMSGIRGIDHLAAHQGLLARAICGSYPSGPSNAEPPEIWKRIGENTMAAYNVPSGILFDMHRDIAAGRSGVMTKVGLDTFVDPSHEGAAMNEAAAAAPIVKKITFEDDEWLFFPVIKPDVAIIRATTADERGNLTFEYEGATLGTLEQALAVRNSGGIVIAQVKRLAAAGTLNAHDVRVPGVLVDHVVVAPDQMQTTQTPYDPAISGEVVRPLDSFARPDFDLNKVMARRVAMELSPGMAVNIGFGISANVPRILLEEGLHGAVTWVIEQGAVGGVPLTGFGFGCASNAEAFMPSPHQFSYFQGGGFDAALLSFLQIDKEGSVNVSRLAAVPHRTAGAGGFVDITSQAKRIVFSGQFVAGARLTVEDGAVRVVSEGRAKKCVPDVDQISFSGRRGRKQGQHVTYVTDRCVMRLSPEGPVVTEIAPGLDLKRDVLEQAAFPLQTAPNLRPMAAALFRPEPMGLELPTLAPQSAETLVA